MEIKSQHNDNDERIEEPRFQLCQGDVFNRVMRLLWLSDEEYQPRPFCQFIALLLITWIPVAILAQSSGLFLNEDKRLAFVFDYAAYGQFFLAMPALLFAQRLIGLSIKYASGRMLYFGYRGENDEENIKSILRRPTPVFEIVPEVVLFLIGYASTMGWIFGEIHNESFTWHAPTGIVGDQTLSLAGIYAAFVAVPIFQYIYLRWIWKVIFWIRVLWVFSRTELKLLPLHPDGTGGLGFLVRVQSTFGIFIFAIGVTVAATIGYKLTIENADPYVFAVWAPILAFAFLAPLAFLLPLGLFSRKLFVAKQEALEYFSRKISECGYCSESVSEKDLSGETYSLEYYEKRFLKVSSMKVFPFDFKSFFQLFGSAVASFLLPLLPFVIELVSWFFDSGS